MKLQIGDKAPDFTTTSDFQGKEQRSWTLSKEVKKSPVLLVFYPGDFTSVCTKQLCDYRDNWESLKGYNVQIVGVSTNDRESHAKFGSTMGFPFALLDDSSRQICSKFGMLMFGLPMAARGLVLVDAQMTIRYTLRETLPFLRRSAREVAQILKTHVPT